MGVSLGSPRDAAQNQNARERIIERPGVVTEQCREGAALADVLRPHLRPGFVTGFLTDVGLAQHLNRACVAFKFPVDLVVERNRFKALRDGVRGHRAVHFKRPVVVAALARPDQARILRLGLF